VEENRKRPRNVVYGWGLVSLMGDFCRLASDLGSVTVVHDAEMIVQTKRDVVGVHLIMVKCRGPTRISWALGDLDARSFLRRRNDLRDVGVKAEEADRTVIVIALSKVVYA